MFKTLWRYRWHVVWWLLWPCLFVTTWAIIFFFLWPELHDPLYALLWFGGALVLDALVSWDRYRRYGWSAFWPHSSEEKTNND